MNASDCLHVVQWHWSQLLRPNYTRHFDATREELKLKLELELEFSGNFYISQNNSSFQAKFQFHRTSLLASISRKLIASRGDIASASAYLACITFGVPNF